MRTALLLALFAVCARRPVAALPAAGAGELSTPERARALYLADLLISEGRIDEAERWVRLRLESDPEQGDWTLRLARIHSARLEPEKALELYQRLLAERGEDAGLLIQLGHEAQRARRNGLAREAWGKARELTPDPAIPYYLSSLALSEGDEAESRRWAALALEGLEFSKTPEDERRKLELRARFGWKDSFDDDYGRLFDAQPREAQTLAAWAGALIRAGVPRSAEEPLALLRERFPSAERKADELDAALLEARGDEAGLARHLEASLRRFPGEPAFLLQLGELELRRKRWDCAELALSSAAGHPDYGPSARQLILDARDRGHHHAGPFLRWREGENARAYEAGVRYDGLPWRGIRVESEAARDTFRRKSTGVSRELSGVFGSAAVERGRWEAGLQGDLRLGDGRSSFAPGAFGRWTPNAAWSLEAESWLGRLWRDSASALDAGVERDEFELFARWRPLRRFASGLRYRHDRLTAKGGGAASQDTVAPELSWTVRERPVYAALSYSYVLLDASDDALFRSQLALTKRSRAQYAILSAGRRWLDGRARADGFVFNGHEPERGRRFGRGDLVGLGFNLEFLWRRWRLSAGYSSTLEGEQGVAGRSQKVSLTAQWRWAPRRPEPCEEGGGFFR